MEKNKNTEERIKLLKERIADLKSRFPAHSLKVEMLQELEALEEELENLLRDRNLHTTNKIDGKIF